MTPITHVQCLDWAPISALKVIKSVRIVANGSTVSYLPITTGIYNCEIREKGLKAGWIIGNTGHIIVVSEKSERAGSYALETLRLI